ncbi:hypothetical protein NDU88_003484 [Pleurodeles waltl]|uniref:Uncharacterized protein n=1 Tax=Pleurodeles waltl TaxID=8319 RepID=A0AAV7V0Q2_PLEWA|nr:hypothetical protein NDU88_003484 [Pleurodeles waltl]
MPKFLAPEGPTESRGEGCHLRADLSPCGGTELGAGPGRCRGPVAAPESVAERARLGRPERRPAACRPRVVRDWAPWSGAADGC